MRFKELLQTAERASTPAEIKGRRRLGRNDQVGPEGPSTQKRTVSEGAAPPVHQCRFRNKPSSY